MAELRVKLDDATRNERVLQEENRFAKEKIEELSRATNSENDERHSYFKKELEKTTSHIKKLEQAHSKLTEEKEALRKQGEETQN